MELDEEQLKRLGLDPSGPKTGRELSASETKLMGLDPSGPGSLLNKARVLGTSAIGGASSAIDFPLTAAAGIDDLGMRGTNWVMRKLGLTSMNLDQLRERRRKAGYELAEDYRPSITKAAEYIGIPTDEKAEATRLKEPWTPTLEALTSGVRTATGAATLGAGPLVSALAGAGAGTGRAVGGDAGEIAGAFFAPMAAPAAVRALAARATKPPAMSALSQQADDAWDAFRRTPATVDSATFAPFAQKTQQRVAAQTSQLTRPPAALKEIGDDVDRVLKSGADVSMDDLWKLRQSINTKLQSRALENSDKRVLKTLRNDLDGYTSTLTPGPGTTGNIDRAVTLMKEGISTTKKLKDSQQLEGLIKNAELSAKTWFGGSAHLGNLNQHLRREYGKLIKSGEINKFAPDVQREIRKVSAFGLPKSALEMVGKFAPTSIIPGAAATYGHLTGDEDAWWLASLAMTARLGANRMGLNQAKRAASSARRATPAPAQPNSLRYLAPAYGGYLAGQ